MEKNWQKSPKVVIITLAPGEDDEDEGAEKVEHQPSQCFLYDACSRSVLPATADCPLTK
jgi:hypothetical protein